MIQIQSTANAARNGVNCLLYGPSGSGKTPMVGTAPSVFIASGEKGLLSLANKNIPYAAFDNYAQLCDICQWFASSREADQFYTFAVDSFSEVIEVLLTEEKRKNKDMRKAYGEMADQGIALARWFRDLPTRSGGKHSVVLIAKEEYVKDESTGILQYQPMMPGNKLGNQLPYFFDETFHLEIGKDQQGNSVPFVRTRRTYNIVARDRSGKLNEFEQSDLTQLFTKILT